MVAAQDLSKIALEYQYILKLIIGGDPNVGKTAIRDKYLGNSKKGNYLYTESADFKILDVEIEMNGIVYPIRFQIWDLYETLAYDLVKSCYFNSSNGAIMVFDQMNKQSFEKLIDWITKFWNVSKLGKMPVVIAGHKSDLKEIAEPAVTSEEITKLLSKLQNSASIEDFSIPYFETSALTGENIERVFETLMKISFLFALKRKNTKPLTNSKNQPFNPKLKLTI